MIICNSGISKNNKLLDNTKNEQSKLRTRNWAEINDESPGTHKASNQIKFEVSVIRSNVCDYSDAYILVSGTMTIYGGRDSDVIKQADE